MKIIKNSIQDNIYMWAYLRKAPQPIMKPITYGHMYTYTQHMAEMKLKFIPAIAVINYYRKDGRSLTSFIYEHN